MDVRQGMVGGVFALPERLAGKADPAYLATDERHFAAVSASLEGTVAELTARLDEARRMPGGIGRGAMDRDDEVRRLATRLRALTRFSLDLCLGRMVPADGSAPVYVGRLGLTDPAGQRLLVDWRSPAAEPFFAATRANPMGLASRRRYRWVGGRITDYWDEALVPGLSTEDLVLDDESAFLAGLDTSRSGRMRDVLGTISADQDAAIRADSRGALVVDGGPGTGKTVVALHRAAYLLYADPRLGDRRGGVLVVGPHEPYLAYVEDVLPGLGEEGVRTCTLRDLLPEGATAVAEADPEVARLKASVAMVRAIEPAVRFYEEPPTGAVDVETEWGDVRIGADDWAEAFSSADPGTPHNEAREQVWEELTDLVAARLDDDVPEERLRATLRRDGELVDTFGRAWPVVEATDLVGDLWSVPAYLRLAAPWLTADEVRLLQREDPQAWTVSDLPLLDAARQRLGDPEAATFRRRYDAAVATERARMHRVVDDMVEAVAADGLVVMLRQEGLQDALVDDAALPELEVDPLAGPFAHIVVDEAQELTDAEWQMLLARCPSRSLTVVGDRAQARHGFTESWQERLGRIGLDRVTQRSLTINYRTPEEVMAEAESVIRAALPDANVPTSVRHAGIPVTHGSRADLDAVLQEWLGAHDEGVACVIADPVATGLPDSPRVRTLTPTLAKGLEFDLVVLLDPDSWGEEIEGAVDRYVAMTRTTQQLVVLK